MRYLPRENSGEFRRLLTLLEFEESLWHPATRIE